MIGIKLPNHKNISLKEIKSYLNPKKVFFSCDSSKLLVKNNNSVKEGDIIGKDNFDLPIIASISGKIKIKSNENNSQITVINNNQEKIYNDDVNYKHMYTKQEFIKILKENAIVGMSGNGKPTYLKYKNSKKIKTLIINGVECDPYSSSDYIIAINHTKEIIKTIDWIMQILNIKECFIAIKNNNPLEKEKLLTSADKYKKIKVIEVPNLYPMGWEKVLVRYIKHTDYKNSPLENGIVINNISTIFAIHNALKNKKPLTERYVTFTGNGLKKPCNVLVKIGTKVEEIIEFLNEKCDDVIYIENGPLMGEEKDLKDFVITPKTNCILVQKKYKTEESLCIKCGKCVDHCPVKIAPALILKYKDNKKVINRLNLNKCIECGICNYVCPSKIDIRKIIKERKK